MSFAEQHYPNDICFYLPLPNWKQRQARWHKSKKNRIYPSILEYPKNKARVIDNNVAGFKRNTQNLNA